MPYDFDELANGSLVIKDVEVMTTLAMEERPELIKLGRGIDMAWLRKTIEVFEQLKATGKRPFLLLRHNKKDRAAEVIGRLDNLHLANNWIVADVLVTNPDTIEKIKRGEMPNRSPEFSPGRNLIWGLSLIEGQEGHLDSRLPELVLKELVLLEAADDLCHEMLNLSLELKERTMSFTDEDLVKLAAMVEKIVEKKLAEKKPEKTTEGPEKDVALAVAEIKQSYDEGLAEVTQKNEVDTFVIALRSGGVVYTDGQLRKLFAEKKTTEGRKELFLRLQSVTNEGMKLAIDSDDSAPKFEDELKQEFADYKKRNPDTKVTEEFFIELATGQNKVNLSGKHVNVVA